MLDVFITSRVRRKIVVIYAKYPDFKTHVRGLAKLIKEDAGNFQQYRNCFSNAMTPMTFTFFNGRTECVG